MAPPKKTPSPLFAVGAEVEVSSDEEGFIGAWFEARVIRAPNRAGRYTVAYDAFVNDANKSSSLLEKVGADHIRPRPPPSSPSGGLFCLDQPVEALQNDAWWSGIVSCVREGRPEGDGGKRYGVRFGTGEECLYGPEELRPRLEWIGGEWVEPVPQNVQKVEYMKGTLVEVSSDDEGFKGAWYTATIVEPVGNNMFLVEYLHLKTDDETELLKETTDSLHIRPVPPETATDETFKLLEEVDAHYNDGWWVGVISKVLDDSKFTVYFKTTMEEMEFEQKELRLHHEWIDGKWLRVSEFFTPVFTFRREC